MLDNLHMLHPETAVIPWLAGYVLRSMVELFVKSRLESNSLLFSNIK